MILDISTGSSTCRRVQRPEVIDDSLIAYKSSQCKIVSSERAVSVVWFNAKGRWPRCNWNFEYNVAHMYHDWLLYLSAWYQEQTINMEPKKSASSFVFISLDAFIMKAGLNLNLLEALFICFQDSPQDHSHLLMSREIIILSEKKMMNLNILDFNGLNWD